MSTFLLCSGSIDRGAAGGQEAKESLLAFEGSSPANGDSDRTSPDVKRMKATLVAYKAWLTRSCNKIEDILKKPQVDSSLLKTAVKQLEDLEVKCREIVLEYCVALDDPDIIEREIDSVQQWFDRALELKANGHNAIQKC